MLRDHTIHGLLQLHELIARPDRELRVVRDSRYSAVWKKALSKLA
jgi:hypothetical protein